MLKSLKLVNFRTYTNISFTFSSTTIIVGPNTIGKTNILEAIHMLSTGRSFRAEKDVDTIQFDTEFARIEAEVKRDSETDQLVLQMVKQPTTLQKRFLLNTVPRRQSEFASKLSSVLFAPHDLALISESPSLRRRYIDAILVQADSTYRRASLAYEKALRQRNKLLSMVKDGKRIYSDKEFEYWNTLLLENSTIITQQRAEYIEYVNVSDKTLFPLHLTYDHSIFSLERVEKYKDAEQAAGITLIGPQRDDISIEFPNHKPVKEFASRGEQRLAVMQLKLLEIAYLNKALGENPILLIDDIYSELDQENISLVTRLLPEQQALITTTHLEFIPEEILNPAKIIDLTKPASKQG